MPRCSARARASTVGARAVIRTCSPSAPAAAHHAHDGQRRVAGHPGLRGVEDDAVDQRHAHLERPGLRQAVAQLAQEMAAGLVRRAVHAGAEGLDRQGPLAQRGRRCGLRHAHRLGGRKAEGRGAEEHLGGRGRHVSRRRRGPCARGPGLFQRAAHRLRAIRPGTHGAPCAATCAGTLPTSTAGRSPTSAASSAPACARPWRASQASMSTTYRSPAGTGCARSAASHCQPSSTLPTNSDSAKASRSGRATRTAFMIGAQLNNWFALFKLSLYKTCRAGPRD